MSTRNLLINLREKKQWTQEKLAKKLDVTQQTVSLIENGKRNPTILMAKRLELIFNIPMEELFPDIFLKIKTTECNIKGSDIASKEG